MTPLLIQMVIVLLWLLSRLIYMDKYLFNCIFHFFPFGYCLVSFMWTGICLTVYIVLSFLPIGCVILFAILDFGAIEILS